VSPTAYASGSLCLQVLDERPDGPPLLGRQLLILERMTPGTQFVVGGNAALFIVREIACQRHQPKVLELESGSEPSQHMRRWSADLASLELLQICSRDPSGVGDCLQRPTMLFACVSQRFSKFGQHERVCILLCIVCQL
jgi:hypothetical protein